jgi:hypothetical protein
VPPVRPSLAATADVEAVPVAPTQPEDDVMPLEIWVESWTSEPHVVWVESWPSQGRSQSRGHRVGRDGSLRSRE